MPRSGQKSAVLATEQTPIAETRPGGEGGGWRRGERWAAFLSGLPLGAWQAIFFIGPLCLLVAMSFWSVRDFQPVAEYTLDNWKETFSAPYFGSVYLRTLLYATAAAVIVPLFAFPVAYALAFKVSPRVRWFVAVLFILPFFTSYIVRSYSWRVLLSEDGALNQALESIGLGKVSFLGGPVGLLIGYFNYFFPIIVLVLLLSLLNVDRTLISAAKNLGAKRWRTLLTVTLPAARIGIVFAVGFAFILAFGDFISPSQLGAGKMIMMSTLVVDSVQGGADFPKAAVVGLTMAVTVIAALFTTYLIAFPRRRSD